MQPIPEDILRQFNAVLEQKAVPSSLRDAMIYTHCVPGRTVKEAKSPLDF
jgi:hypothetical protein